MNVIDRRACLLFELSRKMKADDLGSQIEYEKLADKDEVINDLYCQNVRVNAVLPGFVKTPMTDAMPPEVLKKICEGIPMNRMGEVSGLIKY